MRFTYRGIFAFNTSAKAYYEHAHILVQCPILIGDLESH